MEIPVHVRSLSSDRGCVVDGFRVYALDLMPVLPIPPNTGYECDGCPTYSGLLIVASYGVAITRINKLQCQK
jgi:hypothetical protein